jgi:hypothetical protein
LTKVGSTGLSIRAAAFDTYGSTVRTLRQFLEAVHALAAYVRDLMLPNPDKKSACTQVGSLMIADSLEGLGCLADDIRVSAGCGFA